MNITSATISSIILWTTSENLGEEPFFDAFLAFVNCPDIRHLGLFEWQNFSLTGLDGSAADERLDLILLFLGKLPELTFVLV